MSEELKLDKTGPQFIIYYTTSYAAPTIMGVLIGLAVSINFAEQPKIFAAGLALLIITLAAITLFCIKKVGDFMKYLARR